MIPWKDALLRRIVTSLEYHGMRVVTPWRPPTMDALYGTYERALDHQESPFGIYAFPTVHPRRRVSPALFVMPSAPVDGRISVPLDEIQSLNRMHRHGIVGMIAVMHGNDVMVGRPIDNGLNTGELSTLPGFLYRMYGRMEPYNWNTDRPETPWPVGTKYDRFMTLPDES